MAQGNSIPQKTPDRAVHKQNHNSKKKIRKKPLFYIKEIIENIFSGIIIGSTMLVDGVNLGATANIIGVYDKLVSSINNIFRNSNYSFFLFSQIIAGIIAGIFLFSQMVFDLIEKFEYPMMYLFIGAIIGSLPSIFHRGRIKKFKLLYLFWIILGVGFVYALSLLPKNNFVSTPTEFHAYGMLYISGILSAIAMFIPGISVIHILYVFGMYNSVLSSIINLNFLNLSLVFLGFFTGCLLMAKVMSSAIKRFPAQTHLIIIGFMLASIIEIFPGIPNNYIMIACIAGFIFGAGGVYLITK